MTNTIPSDIAFTPAVKRIQQAKGSRSGYAKLEQGRGWRNCTQHIHERFSREQIKPTVDQLQARIRTLERELADARRKIPQAASTKM